MVKSQNLNHFDGTVNYISGDSNDISGDSSDDDLLELNHEEERQFVDIHSSQDTSSDSNSSF